MPCNAKNKLILDQADTRKSQIAPGRFGNKDKFIPAPNREFSSDARRENQNRKEAVADLKTEIPRKNCGKTLLIFAHRNITASDDDRGVVHLPCQAC